jgi:hypothetical protein
MKKESNPNQSEIDLILVKSKSSKSNPLQNFFIEWFEVAILDTY